MTLRDTVELGVAMAGLAAIPSLSVFTVIARALAWGTRHGVLTALGVVLGDAVLLLVALFGLSALAAAAGGAWPWLRVAAAAYLAWMGWEMWRAASAVPQQEVRGPIIVRDATHRVLASVGSGLALTLGDQKAWLFYLAFLPGFVDLTRVTAADVMLILMLTVVGVGGVKCGYAVLAGRIGGRIDGPVQRLAQRAAALLVGAVALTVLWPDA